MITANNNNEATGDVVDIRHQFEPPRQSAYPTLPAIEPPPPARAAVAEWLAALRSGDVRQGRSYLLQATTSYGDGSAYCCLGLACELSGIGEWDVTDVTPGGYDASGYVTGGEPPMTGSLPELVQLQLGLRTKLGEFRITSEWLAEFESGYPAAANHLVRLLPIATIDGGGSLPCTLSALNDGGFSFAEIADVIESNPPGMFAAAE